MKMTIQEKAIEQLERISSHLSAIGEKEDYTDIAIHALEQARPKGTWLDKKTTIKGAHGLAYGRYGCSVCKKKQPSKTNFCPNCGADMRGEEE